MGGKPSNRKCVAFGIILLFLVTWIIPGIAQNPEKPLTISKGTWFYVGGDGPGNYSSIQEAINDSADGDTVFVYASSAPYYENLIVKTSINLLGEERNTTIIDGQGSGTVICSKTSNVTICGFFLQNSGEDIWKNAGILLSETENNTIVGNIIANNRYGIYCYRGYWPSSDHHTISDNIIRNNTQGIFLDASFKNEVYENIIQNTTSGIVVGSSILPSNQMGYSPDTYPIDIYKELYNNIFRNTISKNKYGIYMQITVANNVFENSITTNQYGIIIRPPYLCGCVCNNIYHNTISNNTYGIYAETGDEDISIMGNCHITANVISKNNIMYNQAGITFHAHGGDILIFQITRNKITYNNFIGNTKTASFQYSFFNRWIGNYWDKPRQLPYPLIGTLIIYNKIFPWITFDWSPAPKPYDI